MPIDRRLAVEVDRPGLSIKSFSILPYHITLLARLTHTHHHITQRQTPSHRRRSPAMSSSITPSAASSSSPWADPLAPLPASEQPKRDIEDERRKASFQPASLTRLIDGGSDRTARRRFLRGLVLADPIFSNEDSIYLNHTERYNRALAKCARLDQLIQEHGLGEEEAGILRACSAEDLPTLLHDLMFLPCILALCDEEQQAAWVPLARSKKMLGCYAQTEVGHGSNLRALQTTATYLPETDEFELWTPTLESCKWWPGTLGRTANTAMVIARLRLPADPSHPEGTFKDLGIHNFVVPLRDRETHALLPGVVTRDIGPKIAFNGMDNGCLELRGVRVPRFHMCSRFSRVERGGAYVKVPDAHPKVAYLTMMQVRALIVVVASRDLSKAATIATRYSAVRRQGFADESGKAELQILDYPSQQYRLLPLLAAAVAFFFSGRSVLTMLRDTEAALASGSAGPAEIGARMARAHASLAGLKSLSTTIAAEGIEDCRRCCGGHGYLASSGLPELSGNFLQQVTVEGDNVLLTQQTAGYLLKAYMRLISQGPAALKGDGDVGYMAEAQQRLQENDALPLPLPDLRCPRALLRLFQARAFALVERLALKLQRLTAEEGKGQQAAWRLCLVDVMGVSRAHALATCLQHFAQGIAALQANTDPSGLHPARDDPGLLPLLRRLLALFALVQLGKDAAADCLELGLLAPQDVARAREEVITLLAEVRPDAVAICDGFDWHDFELKSTLGRADGDVYRALLEAAKREPLNHQDPVSGFHHNWRPAHRSLATAKL